MKKIILTESQDTYSQLAQLIEDGYLIHGTTKEFDEFDPAYIQGGCRGKEGYGFYFTDMAYKCQEYSNGIYKMIPKDSFNFIELTANVSKGSNLYKKLFGDEEKEIELANLNSQFENCCSVREYEYLENEISKVQQEAQGLISGVDKEAFISAIKHYNIDNLGQLQYFVMNPKYYIPVLAKALLKLGYDGGHYDGIYTVWNFDKLNNLVQTKRFEYGE